MYIGYKIKPWEKSLFTSFLIFIYVTNHSIVSMLCMKYFGKIITLQHNQLRNLFDELVMGCTIKILLNLSDELVMGCTTKKLV